MSEAGPEIVDPRILRTRRLLQEALEQLLEAKEFEKISVQDIAEAATVNRVTFYDHFTDKFALLEYTVGSRFQELLAQRGVTFDGTCASALRAIVLGVCDYLATTRGRDCVRHRQMEPHLQVAISAVVRRMILDGLRTHPAESSISPQMIASTVSAAICGAAQEWLRTPHRCSSEAIADTVLLLVSPILRPLHAEAHQ